MKTKTIITFLVLLVSLFCQAPVRAQEADVLVNKSVIDLHQLGLGDGVIIDKIKSSRCNFDTGIESLKQLKAAGISEGVMSAMITAAKPAAAAPAPPGDPNDPTAMHEPGIWFFDEGKKKMTKLEASAITRIESGGGAVWGMAWGATAKSRADLNGSAAAFQITQKRPVFYFYFEGDSGATSPNEFVLAQMEVKKKDDRRRLVVGQMNAYSGSQSGPENKDVRATTFDKIAPGIFKVSPKQDLAPGEYAFFHAGNTPIVGYGYVIGAGGRLFDFGVQP
ncbi:MAG TPA: hypothetical protein VHB20_10095 [Verrucomicrobiae bacterium]|nr:hypothetical protein [Verrucomicrobiae bacterium]